MEKIYIVTAYRWGNSEMHSYVLGAFDTISEAMLIANSHCDYRGGKYACVVDECLLNHFENGDELHTKEVYRAKSLND